MEFYKNYRSLCCHPLSQWQRRHKDGIMLLELKFSANVQKNIQW